MQRSLAHATPPLFPASVWVSPGLAALMALALSAALPRDWTPTQVFFAITVILSLVGWTTLGREVRGRFLALREEDFVLAARLAGCGRMRIILRHMVPTFLSHIIATASLAIPVPRSRHGDSKMQHEIAVMEPINLSAIRSDPNLEWISAF